MIPESLLELGEFFGEGYKPVLDFHGWRVAMLRYCDAFDVKHLHQVERHRETNEVFILTAGEADLILFEGADKLEKAHVVPMKLNVAYNIAAYGWHHIITSKDAHVIIFELTNTSRENSDYIELDPEQLAAVKSQLRFKEA
ncbi:MAG: hypothetical protein KC422_09090 [Trueperaceae bacterium]|nr:hypothetical protein [Trueperaceae bacterium]